MNPDHWRKHNLTRRETFDKKEQQVLTKLPHDVGNTEHNALWFCGQRYDFTDQSAAMDIKHQGNTPWTTTVRQTGFFQGLQSAS